MKALILFLLLIPTVSFAQGFRMSGEFTLFGNSSAPLRGTYNMTWVETQTSLEGRYSDNVLTPNASLTGFIFNGRRKFTVMMPSQDERHGVKSLTIETAGEQGMIANAPTTIIANDLNGNPIDTTAVFASISPDSAVAFQPQKSSNCSTGFGLLTGLCGLYSGNVSESADSADRCNLIGTRLELAANGELSLYFNYSGTLRNIPRHNFGSLLGTPMSLNINTTVRHCGFLPGTTMNSVGCQVLHLVGSFQDYGSIKNFSGTYDIRDEVTGSTCSLSLNLGREAIY